MAQLDQNALPNTLSLLQLAQAFSDGYHKMKNESKMNNFTQKVLPSAEKLNDVLYTTFCDFGDRYDTFGRGKNDIDPYLWKLLSQTREHPYPKECKTDLANTSLKYLVDLMKMRLTELGILSCQNERYYPFFQFADGDSTPYVFCTKVGKERKRNDDENFYTSEYIEDAYITFMKALNQLESSFDEFSDAWNEAKRMPNPNRLCTRELSGEEVKEALSYNPYFTVGMDKVRFIIYKIDDSFFIPFGKKFKFAERAGEKTIKLKNGTQAHEVSLSEEMKKKILAGKSRQIEIC